MIIECKAAETQLQWEKKKATFIIYNLNFYLIRFLHLTLNS